MPLPFGRRRRPLVLGPSNVGKWLRAVVFAVAQITLRCAVLAVLLAVAVFVLLPCDVFAQHHMASEMLLTEGLDNNLCAYNALISGCTSSRGYDRALGYYKDMVSLVRELGC